MRSPRPRAHTGPLVVATALTSWVTLMSWGGFVDNNAIYIIPLVLGIPLVSAAGALARWARFPVVIVLASQLLAILLFANLVWGGTPIPTGESIERAVRAFGDSVDAMQQYAAPIPTHVRSIAPVLVLGGMACHLLVDLCAVTLGRVPVAGLPLLVMYTLPVSVLNRSVSWIVFVLAVTGFLVMLALQEGSRISRWGRQFGAPKGETPSGPAFGARDARRHPVAIGTTATALAVVLPVFIPTIGIDLAGVGGSGPGSGDRQVRITNPMTDLRRDLNRGEDVPLLRVRTAGPRPDYLRVSVLTTFTGQAWTPGDRDLPAENALEGQVPQPPGLSVAVPSSTRDWDVSVTDDLSSLWLPAPLYVAAVNAGSDWRYDEETMDFHSSSDDIDTSGLSYSLTELVPEFAGEMLADATSPAPNIRTRYADAPDNLPDVVAETAREVTKDFETDYEKAQALQRWFRNGQFEYSTNPAAGNGNDALVEFLDEKIGYCEQFASAMAVMLRSLGIPARVAVGFLRPTDVGEETWEFSSHDLHAWPEVYFEGSGWVNFEPTPQDRAIDVPTHTDDQIEDEEPTAIPSDRSSTPTPTTRPNQPTEQPTEQAPEQAEQDQDEGISPVPFLWGGGALLLLGLVGFGPRLLRQARSDRRWRHPGDPVETAWLELRDGVRDLGLAWPGSVSPRAAGILLARQFGTAGDRAERPRTGAETNPVALAALERLVRAVEEARYSAGGSAASASQLREDVTAVVDGLRAGVTPRARRRADWWPASVVGLRRTTVAAPSITRMTRQQDVVDHVT